MNQIFYDAVGNNPIIAAVKNMEDIEEVEELSGKDRANLIKRQRRYQELQKEIEDMRKVIF